MPSVCRKDSLDNIQKFSGQNSTFAFPEHFQSGNLNHFKITFADTALRAFPVCRHVLPDGSWSNAIIRPTLCFIVFHATNRTPVFFHRDFLQNKHMQNRPSILVFAGHDPSGGAGIQADVETINDLGAHACTIITALTVQNSHNLQAFQSIEPALLKQQFEALHKDITFSAVKIGMIGSEKILATIIQCLQSLPGIPVVLDPVLAAGGGAEVSNQAFIQALKNQLLPIVTVATPNLPEAQRLSGKSDLNDCASSLLAHNCRNIIITGTHAQTRQVTHTLFTHNDEPYAITGERLSGQYHGSGCTFASALTSFMAQKHSVKDSFRQAQDYTFSSLLHADTPGHGQQFPQRRQHGWDK